MVLKEVALCAECGHISPIEEDLCLECGSEHLFSAVVDVPDGTATMYMCMECNRVVEGERPQSCNVCKGTVWIEGKSHEELTKLRQIAWNTLNSEGYTVEVKNVSNG